MKYCLVILMLLTKCGFAQQWQAEVMAGVSNYNGDLSGSSFSFKNLGPAISVNLKYVLPVKYIALRGGIAYGRVSGDDKNNKDVSVRNRNLNFHTHILEGSFGAELNLLDPEYFSAFPYLFVAVGVFHFDPYTFDKNHQKTFLRSLGTEGQGLLEYKGKKMYSLTQFCIPVGGGWKWTFNERYEIIYEFGARYLLTDYLDDVSTSYVNPQILQAERGRIATELAYRQTTGYGAGAPIDGRQRGNPKVKDWYYMTGIKLLIKLD
jgi:hypothetical protein